MPNGRLLGLKFKVPGRSRGQEPRSAQNPEATTDEESGPAFANENIPVVSGSPRGSSPRSQAGYEVLTADDTELHCSSLHVQEQAEPETCSSPVSAAQQLLPAEDPVQAVPRQERPQLQDHASLLRNVSNSSSPPADYLSPKDFSRSSQTPLVGARDAQIEKPPEPANTAASQAWCRFFLILGGSLAGVFVASTGTGMAATVYLAALSTTTTTTTTTTTITATTTLASTVTLTTATRTSTHTQTSSTATITTTTKTRTSTTLTITTRTSTSTSTSTRTYTGIAFLPSLFCFTSTQPSGDELELLRIQQAQRRGIFACNDWEVFSQEEVWLSPGETKTLRVSGPEPKAVPVPGHPEWRTVQNTAYFMRLWDVIRDKGLARRTEWTVKADADAMFFPIRLRQYIKRHRLSSSHKSYLLNCEQRHVLLGSLEVFSRPAALAYADGRERCMQHMNWQHSGEDEFAQECLDSLDVKGLHAWPLVEDARCGPTAGACKGDHTVAYHPFKDVASQFACLEALKGTSGISAESPVTV